MTTVTTEISDATAEHRANLHTAFELVENKANWKLPINKVLPYSAVPTEAALNEIREAIIYYTGSIPTITFSSEGVRFTAIGYYNAIGA